MLDKLISFACDFKPLSLMYFSGGVFVYMMIDLVWMQQGALETIILWQILLAAILCTITHYVFYIRFLFPILNKGTRLLAHLTVTLGIMIGIAIGFRWFVPSFASVCIFFGIFIVTYFILFYAFGLYYKMMNQHLQAYKQK